MMIISRSSKHRRFIR